MPWKPLFHVSSTPKRKMNLHRVLFQLEHSLRPLHLGSALKLQKLNSQLAKIALRKIDGRIQPLFLISICSFNGEKWISDAVQSILNQGYDNWHLHITDDGSSDSTPNILKQFKQQLPNKITLNLLEENCSPLSPANYSIQFFLENKQFSAFTILDHDDAAEKDWLQNCAKLLKGKTKVLRCRNARCNETLSEIKYTYPAAAQIVAVREVIERVGKKVTRDYPMVSDTEYLQRIEQDAIINRYAVVLTPFLCQKMRVHGANQTLLGTTKPV